jgi:hypothetical protein
MLKGPSGAAARGTFDLVLKSKLPPWSTGVWEMNAPSVHWAKDDLGSRFAGCFLDYGLSFLDVRERGYEYFQGV